MKRDNDECISGTTPVEVDDGLEVSDEVDGQGEQPTVTPAPPTAAAQRLRTLKQASFRAAEKRERLPQPLFWSLFHEELRQIKKEKRRDREVTAFLNSILRGE